MAMPVGGAAGTIVECNWSGSKTRQRARRLRGYSGPFASGHPMSVLLPKGGMPRVAAECAIVRPIKFGDFVKDSSSDHCSDKIEILPHGDCLLWVKQTMFDGSPLYPPKADFRCAKKDRLAAVSLDVQLRLLTSAPRLNDWGLALADRGLADTTRETKGENYRAHCN